MAGTNREYETMIEHIDRGLMERERALVAGRPVAGGIASLRQLRETRRSIRTLLLNRKIEASKPVVNFARWRDGDGALRREMADSMRGTVFTSSPEDRPATTRA